MDAQWMQRFVDFGVDPLLSHHSLLNRMTSLVRWDADCDSPDKIRTQMRRHVATSAPKAPGVYGMIDALGRLVYVGKSKALRNRLLSYFLPGCSDEKAGRIVEMARSLVWEVQPNEFAALLREQALIRRWQPTLNVVGMPHRQQAGFLCLGRGPAEQLYLARQYDPTASACQGPFFGTGQMHRAIEVLNRHFRLRDCSQKTPTHLTNQLTLFQVESRAGCLRGELGTCIAPCQVGSLRSSYAAQEVLARQFLNGDALDTVSQLEQDMHKAAAGHHFERAARIREDLRIMKWLVKKLSQHRKARESAPQIYWEPDDHALSSERSSSRPGMGVLYLIRCGGIESSVACPSSDKEWKRTRRDISQWLDSEEQLRTSFLRSSDSLGLVTAWFQRNPGHKKRLFPIKSLDQIPNSLASMRRTWLTEIAA